MKNQLTMNFKITNILLIYYFLSTTFLHAQESAPIRDNSFFIEEAFNQEKGVVQHINNLTTSSNFKNLLYTFTQEWPVKSEMHQLSYTIPLIFREGTNRAGDIFLNYRYQLLQKNNTYLSPRFSILLPTGKTNDGNRNTGVQINIPFSYELKNTVAFHMNIGSTHLWNNDEEATTKTTLINYGGSFIWLINSHINLMTECAYTNAYSGINNEATNAESLILNPGFRGAINFKSGLQIVPGFSAWFDTINKVNGFFFYLSFEHPFMKEQ